MGKYLTAQDDVFSILSSPEWEADGIRAFPAGYKGEKGDAPYVLVTIVPSGTPLNASSSSGVLLIEIFTAWGEGPAPTSIIADLLDKHFQKRTVNQTQMFNSACDRLMQDRDNPALGRAIYTLPFSHFGVD